MSSTQHLLNAIEVAQQKFKEVREKRLIESQPGIHSGEKRGRDKSYINVEMLESFMKICPYLAIGSRFRNKKDLNQYLVGQNIRYIVNLRPDDAGKGLWYAENAKGNGVKEILHHPLETSADKGRVRVDDAEIMRIANKVVSLMKKAKILGENDIRPAAPVVFVHGYEGGHVACVVALVAWYLYEEDNRFDPLKALEERYDSSIAQNYPECWYHRDQVKRICKRERQSVFAAMKRGKRSKMNVVRKNNPKSKTT